VVNCFKWKNVWRIGRDLNSEISRWIKLLEDIFSCESFIYYEIVKFKLKVRNIKVVVIIKGITSDDSKSEFKKNQTMLYCAIVWILFVSEFSVFQIPKFDFYWYWLQYILVPPLFFPSPQLWSGVRFWNYTSPNASFNATLKVSW